MVIMKKLILFLLLILIGCEQPEPVYVDRILIDKKEEIVSYYNILTKKQVIETNYYLIFSDGSVEEVQIGTYVLAKKGTVYKVRKRR